MKQKLTLILICILTTISVKSQTILSTSGFTANDTVGCVPMVINFQSTTPNAIAWQWNFGNGHYSNLENPVEIFTTNGFYTITLEITKADGTTTQFIRNNYINAVSRPIANIAVAPYDACLNTNSLQFQNTTLGATDYLWDFGDGNYSTDVSPLHHYSSPGAYNVTLIASNTQGCSSNASINTIVIHPVIQNNFQLPTPVTTCNTTHTFSYNATPSGMVSYDWQFSTGATYTGQNIQHVFNAYGNFHLRLITVDNNGCVDSTYKTNVAKINSPNHNFSAATTTNCVLTDITFQATGSAAGAPNVVWDFGDGQQGFGTPIQHSYASSGQYTVTMTATNSSGCTKTVTKNNYITINNTPSATLAVSDTNACVNEAIYFEALSLNAASVKWIFGDGATSILPSVYHAYSNSGNYVVKLVLYNQGCRDTLTKMISVSQTTAQFQNTIQHNCAPAIVSFVDQSISAISWQWNFSNGATSTDQNPSVTFNTPGNFNAQLIVTNANGCSDTSFVSNAVIINNNIPTNYQYAEFNGCSPVAVSFYNYVIGSGFWQWNFGDGTSSNLPVPSHVYTTAGTYVVSLTTMNGNGCNIYIDTFAVVNVNSLEIDSLILDLNCMTGVVNFNAICPNCIQGNWDFGDGATSSNVNISHHYTDEEIYYVSFNGVSGSGCVANQTYSIDVENCNVIQVPGGQTGGAPSNTFSGWASNPNPSNADSSAVFQFCSPAFINMTNPVPNAQNWVWHFGDGTIGYGLEPIHTYNSPGMYSLMLEYFDGVTTDTLYFTNFINVVGHENDIIINSVNTCMGLELSLSSQNTNLQNYFWSINNIPIIGSTPFLDTTLLSNNQLHSITLTTHDEYMCSYSSSLGVVSNGINPSFSMNSPICLGDSLVVSHSIPAGYTATWNYSNSITSAQPFHVYSSPGIYEISVELVSSSGCVLNYVIGEVEVVDPIINFTVLSPSNVCLGDSIIVSAPSITNASYNWNFGGLSFVTNGSNASAIATNAGISTIQLESTSPGCGTSISQQTIIVNQALADFSYVQSNYCLPITAQFTDLSSSATSWNWNFGDGTTSSDQHPSHVFNIMPTTFVTLEITDTNGCQAQISKNNVELFQASISASSVSGCAPIAITFTENSQNPVQWNWNFGDGTTSSLQQPSHSYVNEGTYDVSLVVISAEGCVDTVNINSMITLDKVVADFDVSAGGGCAPQPAYFNNNSYNAVSWQWDFGNGFTSTLQDPIQVYHTGGNYTVQLIAQSASGCIDTLVYPTISIMGPTASFSIVDSSICNYDSIEFINHSQNATSFVWLFGDGSSSTLFEPTHGYDYSDTYQISLITWDANGCQHIATQNTQISIISAPDALITLSDTIGCNPLPITANANSTGMQYKWLLNGSTVGLTPSYYTSLSTGNYNLSLIVENSFGCKDTSETASIEVHPVYTINLTPLTPICETQSSVTVNSSTMLGEWYINGVPNSSNTFDISVLTPGDYTIVQEISTYCGDIDSTVLHIDSLITATLNDPLVVCEYDAAFLLHSSSTLGYWSGNGVTDPFIGLLNPAYANHGINMINYTIVNGACTFTDSTIVTVNPKPNSLFSTNSTYFCEGNSIQLQSPTNPSSSSYLWQFSNINDTLEFTQINPQLSLTPGNWNITLTVEDHSCISQDSILGLLIYDTIAPNTPDIVRSTVEVDAVLTEWKEPQYGIEKVTGFEIWRSIDSVNFKLIDITTSTSTSYLDNKTNVNEENYYYIIIPTNVCMVTPEQNDMSSSILLEKTEIGEDRILFSWSDYYKWQQGVEFYELQQQDKNGNWTTIERVNGTVHSVTIEKP